MAADADELRLTARRVEQLVDGGVPEHGAQVAVERARRAAPLDVAEDRDPGVLAEAILEHRLHVIGGDRLAVDVAGALGDEHDVGPAADAPARRAARRTSPSPSRSGRALGDEDEVGARSPGCPSGPGSRSCGPSPR